MYTSFLETLLAWQITLMERKRQSALRRSPGGHKPAAMKTAKKDIHSAMTLGLLTLCLLNAGCIHTQRTLVVAPQATIRYSEPWKESGVNYTNAKELIRTAREQAGAISQIRTQTVASPLARIVVTTEERTSPADAVRRLQDIAASRPAPARFYGIGGWPAVELKFTEPQPRRGDKGDKGEGQTAPPSLIDRATVAIAVESKVVRFEIWPSAQDTPGLLRQAEKIARSFAFLRRAKPNDLYRILRQLRDDAGQTPQKPQSPPSAYDPKKPATGVLRAGAPVAVGGGAGELEIAASSNAANIVIASNVALSFSTNSGVSYAAGSPGVFGLNDPSVTRAVSGSFYLGVIATPTGTPILGVTGCTNAVSISTVSRSTGASFLPRGYSATCPASGDGICFPDQEHIAADAFNSSASGDQIYAVWRNFTPVWPSTPSSCMGINSFNSVTASIACSQDGGGTWTPRAAIPGAGDFPRLAVGFDGKVYVASLSGDSIVLSRFGSCTGGLTADAGFPVTVARLSSQVACPMPGIDRCNDGNALSSPTVAPDPGNASHLFVTFAEGDGFGGERIVTAESNDSGRTFPNRVTVSTSSSARRFMPWSCSTLGTSIAGWYDRGAAVSGPTNDLTNYVVGSQALSAVNNLSGTPDPQCASGWPFAPRSQSDSESCTIQPQPATFCQNSSGVATANRCDFSSGGCPSGESCSGSTGLGAPKYGDYNGIACAGNFVIAAWASATTPLGLPPTGGLGVFSTRFSLVSPPPARFDRVTITLTSGNDDAHDSSEITASLSGQSQSLCLKPSTSLTPDGICSNGSGATDQNRKSTWDNKSMSAQTFALSDPQSSATGFGTIDIMLRQSGSGGACSSCDNWDIQGISVVATDSTGVLPPVTLLSMSTPFDGDNCIARLKAPPNATTVRFGFGGTDTHVYVDGTGAEPGAMTTCRNNGD